MKLSNDEIKSLISGAVRFLEDSSGIMPLRFTPEQEQWYLKFPQFADKAYASAGIRLDFSSDAKEMHLSYTSCPGSSCKLCYFDVYLDGILVQHCGTDNRVEHPDGVLFLQTDGSVHRITVYFPNLSGVRIHEMELSGGTFLKPEKRQKKLLVYGDSITQGYIAAYPSFAYINRVADHFNMELINKAVGGDTFMPEMGAFKEAFVPDRIFIAYGTNDWSHKKKADFERETQGFFANLRKRFPDVPLHVLLPIWREDHARETFVGTFGYAVSFIRDVCSKYEKVQIIDGFKFYPRMPAFFADEYLHPDDTGFLLMADSIIHEMEKELR